jgi:hypothetical protein
MRLSANQGDSGSLKLKARGSVSRPSGRGRQDINPSNPRRKAEKGVTFGVTRSIENKVSYPYQTDTNIIC